MSSTLHVTAKLVRSIREAMNGATGSDHAQLAGEYARLCREAVQRIDQCATMIEKGSDYQALQLAESRPTLPDRSNAAVRLSHYFEYELTYCPSRDSL